MKRFAVIMAVAIALASNAAFASSNKTTTYAKHGITFTYPATWQVVPASYAKTAGQQLVKDAKGIITLGAAAGVDKLTNNDSQGCGAIIARMKFTSTYRKQLKGKESRFIQLFEKGVKSNASTKILSTGTGSFGGDKKAAVIQAKSTSAGEKVREAIYLYIPKGDKTLDIGVFLVDPQSQWSDYSSAIRAIAASARFS